MMMERQEMKEKLNQRKIFIDVKEEKESSDEDLFNFTWFSPPFFQFLISL